jgi:phosphonate transport system substrate-binding protein
MRLFCKFLVVCMAVFMLTGPVQAADTIRLAVTDLEGLEELQREFGKFQEKLSELTGLEFKFFPVSSRTAAAEALKAKKVDFVLTGPAEYVVMRQRTNAEPIVGFGRPDYFAGIIVLADSGINTVKDLAGKMVAFGDVGSTSNHLAPMQVIADYGLDPRSELKIQHVHRNVAWEGLKRGDVDAIGMNYGKFIGLRSKEKGLEPGAFKVIARGPDLPNDVLMVAPHVDQDVVEKVRNAFTDHSKELIAAILVGEDNQKYRGMKFLPQIKDSDYNYVRSMYATIGYPKYAEFVGD